MGRGGGGRLEGGETWEERLLRRWGSGVAVLSRPPPRAAAITPPASGVMLSSCVEGSTKCCPPAFELAAFGEMTSGTCDELGQRGRAGRGGL